MSFEILRVWQSSMDPAFVHYVIRGDAMPERHLREAVHTPLGRYLVTGLHNAVTTGHSASSVPPSAPSSTPAPSSPPTPTSSILIPSSPPSSPASTSSPAPTPPSSPPVPSPSSLISLSPPSSSASTSPSSPTPPSLPSPEEISNAMAFHFLRTQAGLTHEDLF